MTQPLTAPTTPGPAPTPPASWRGHAVRGHQRAGITIAGLGIGASFLFLVLASTKLLVSQSSWTITPPTEGELHLIAWQYQFAGGEAFRLIEWMYPPLLIGALLFAASLLISVNQGLAGPIRKAQRKLVSFQWSAPEARARMRAELHTAGYRNLVTTHAKVRVVLAGVAAALVTAWAAFVPVTDGFTKGLGPTVCILGGLVTLAGVLMATPWTRWPDVVLLGDGRMMIDGQEPLAALTAPASVPAPAAPMTAAPPPPPPSVSTAPMPSGPVTLAPGWYPDPVGGHERRYWDGAAWTADVADTDAPDDAEHPLMI